MPDENKINEVSDKIVEFIRVLPGILFFGFLIFGTIAMFLNNPGLLLFIAIPFVFVFLKTLLIQIARNQTPATKDTATGKEDSQER